MGPTNWFVVTGIVAFASNLISALLKLTFAEHFLCRNHYFSKSLRQDTIFFCPGHELLSLFIRISQFSFGVINFCCKMNEYQHF